MPWDVNKAVEHLQKHAQPHSIHQCATYTRQAIEAGGIVLERHHLAKDYGISLLRAGFTELRVVVRYQKGDVIVIQNFKDHPEGHMAMYDGSHWISDFKQRELYPGPEYRVSKPPYKVYRNLILWDRLESPTRNTAIG